MASITTPQLLYELRQACHASSLVNYVDIRILDIDILHIRVYLTRAETFINVFYNIATDKTAFALIESGHRIYGVDNAKIGWHRHPFDDPSLHESCSQESFAEFLQETEDFFKSSNQ